MKKLIIIIFITVVIALIAGGVFLNSKKKITYDFITVKPQTLIQEVNVTGQIKPAHAVDLAFEKGGAVSAIYVKDRNRGSRSFKRAGANGKCKGRVSSIQRIFG